MFEYTIKYVNPLGDYSEEFGQRYWGKAHDTDLDVSFNLMHPTNFEDGDKITAETKEIKKSAKGKEYIFLKKVKRGSASSQVALPSDKPKPVSADNKSRDITLGLVYKTFVACEGMLPQTSVHWDTIIDNWQTLLDIANGTYASGYVKAKQVRKTLNADEANKFLKELDDGE